MEKRNAIIILGIVAIIIVGAYLFLKIDDSKTQIIDDFESCVEAGYPVLESYPEQCKTSEGQTFIKKYPFNYSEGLILMQNKDTGEYACFGCGNTMCIDPAPIMETVVENESLYCDGDFNVIINGKPKYMSDGVSLYKNLETGVEACFGCGNTMCIDIMINENISILNESEDKYCNNNFEIIQKTDIILIKENFSDKIVYDASQNIDNLRIDCAARGGTFNECGSPCSSDAEACIMMCAFTCENLN